MKFLDPWRWLNDDNTFTYYLTHKLVPIKAECVQHMDRYVVGQLQACYGDDKRKATKRKSHPKWKVLLWMFDEQIQKLVLAASLFNSFYYAPFIFNMRLIWTAGRAVEHTLQQRRIPYWLIYGWVPDRGLSLSHTLFLQLHVVLCMLAYFFPFSSVLQCACASDIWTSFPRSSPGSKGQSVFYFTFPPQRTLFVESSCCKSCRIRSGAVH